MSGKPAARMGDATLKGGPIIKGSMTVLIGSSGGLACSQCPGGVSVGSPVNPALGAKVLSDETDFALPGPMPLSFSRNYSSLISPANKDAAGQDTARVGLLGPGWHLPTALALQIDAGPTQNNSARLFDGKGRVISFADPLSPGDLLGSLSESLSLYRMEPGTTLTEQGHSPYAAGQIQRRLDQLAGTPWAASGRRAVNVVIAWSTGGQNVWVFERASLLSTTWQLAALVDRWGRTLAVHHDRLGNPAGFTDGAGRRYRLHLIDSRISSGLADEAALPGQASYRPENDEDAQRRQKKAVPTIWGLDDGLRLAAVYLEHDPHDTGEHACRDRLLVAYRYSNTVASADDLAQVLAGSGNTDAGPLLRRFTTHQGFMLAHAYADGGRSQYVYESTPPRLNADATSPKVVQQTNVDGLSYWFDYQQDAQGEHTHTVVTDSLKRRETYRFKGQGGLKRLSEHSRADGTTVRYEHDACGRLSADIDALARKTTYQLDAQGAIASVNGPAGATSSTRDPASGQLLSHTGLDGATSRYAYDAHERLIQVIAPDASTTSLAYPEVGASKALPDQPIRITDASGKHKTLNWSVLGQLIGYTDCSGQTNRYRYHRDGQLAQSTDATGAHSTQSYDRRDRKTQTQSPDGRRVAYHYGGASGLQLASVTEHPAPNSANANAPNEEHTQIQPASTAYHYDERGRLIGVQRGALALGYVWDSADRLSTLLNENNARTQFTYDVRDRLIQEQGFDGRTQQYAYDAGGRLIASREASSGGGNRNSASNLFAQPTTHYTYDQADRLIQRRLPGTAHAGAMTDRMDYDKAGRLTQIARYRGELQTMGQTLMPADREPLSLLAFTYDTMGRLTGEQQRLIDPISDANPNPNPTSFTHATQHAHDVLGNRTGITLPGIDSTLRVLWEEQLH